MFVWKYVLQMWAYLFSKIVCKFIKTDVNMQKLQHTILCDMSSKWSTAHVNLELIENFKNACFVYTQLPIIELCYQKSMQGS